MSATTIDKTILALKAEGKTDAEIRKATGVARDYLRNMRQAGVLPRLQRGGGWNDGGNATEEMRRRMLDCQRQGLNDAQMAERLGIGLSTVRKYRKRWGIPATGKQQANEQLDPSPGSPVTAPAEQAIGVYEFRGDIWIFKAPLSVVEALERAYARTVGVLDMEERDGKWQWAGERAKEEQPC